MRLPPGIDPHRGFTIPLIARPRLAGALGASGRVAVLLAPAGYGKSSILRSLHPPSWLHYRVGTAGATFARFVRGFAAAVAEVAPGAQASFPRAWERALQSGSPETVLARWLCEHLQPVKRDIVIDDLHSATADPSICAFIGEFVHISSERRIAIAAREGGGLPIPLWMATGLMDRPIEASELRFDVHETRELAAACGTDPAAAQAAIDVAGGCPVAVAFAASPRGLLRPDPLRPLRSFDDVAAEILASRSSRERQFLLSASLLPDLRRELLEGCGWSEWAAIERVMPDDAPFMWEVDDSGVPRFHDRFADALAIRLAQEDATFRTALAQRAVSVLIDGGRYGDAIGVAVRQHMAPAVDDLLDAHGFAILESGRVDEITEALGVIDASGVDGGAVSTAIRGYVDARLGRLDTSEAWFQLGLGRAADETSRVAIALYYARELMHQLRDDAHEVLEPYAASQTLGAEMLVDVQSSLGQAYMVADRATDAAYWMQQALEMLPKTSSPALRARALARAAYVAFESGDHQIARRYALEAAPVALAQALYDVATSVYSVLYTIAYEIDDDPQACLHHLACIRDYGMKSGTMRMDLYALVAMYELHTEAGNRERLAELDRAICAIDVKYATLSFLESFLPARAMQAGWAGDFTYSHSVLAPTALRQATPLRRALRWSEVALYAAASAQPDAAIAAIAEATVALAEVTAATTHLAFATLNCALACCVLGDLDSARMWSRRAGDQSIPAASRVDAYRLLVEAILDSHTGVSGSQAALSHALAALHDAAFGGIALLVTALPLEPIAALRRAKPALHAPTVISTFGREDDVDLRIDVLFAELQRAAPLMAEHSQAVSAWCARIARRLNLSQAEITYIARSGLLHDIGKVKTPLSILNAPRRLDSQEWLIMRDHAPEGGRIAYGVPALRTFIPIIRGHHERLDGKGYPDGLKAGAIPLAARIVTVADCFNAMIGRRPYRLPMSPLNALDELERNRHTQFDPEVVEAMIRIVMGLTAPTVPLLAP